MSQQPFIAIAALAYATAAHADATVLRHTAIIEAPVCDVWAMWATSEGLASWIAPHADIELRLGGKMRVNYHVDGQLGDSRTIENTILSFEPLRMLSLQATRAPGGFPFADAIKGTWSVTHFEPQGKSRTRLTITGLGYTSASESQRMKSFFDWGNEVTLRDLQERITGVPSVDDPNANNRSVPVQNRRLVKEVTVDGTLADVWHAWTTSEGVKGFFAPESTIELTPGGAYDMHFFPDNPVGQKGAEGCNILAFLPMQMLAFDWTAPPAVPKLRTAGVKSQVILEFDAAGPARSKIRLTQTGFGAGADWEKYYDYFDKAWDSVLGRFTTTLVSDDPRLVRAEETWVDGQTIVSRISHPAKRQDFQVIVPATAGNVWKTLTTTEGIRTFYPTDAFVELAPGGKYDLHEGTPNTVMAFIPNRMLAVTGSAPPQFPRVQKGGTWAVILLDKLGEEKTRIRMASVGWKEGDPEFDAAYEYFLKANAVFMNMLHRRFIDGPLSARKHATGS